MKELRLGPDFAVPIDIVSSAIGVLGIRGSGKTTTAGVLVEEAIEAGVPCAIIDPIGSWFGLKSSADGKSVGLPVYVFGGEHADVPLEETAGAIVARFIIEKRVPVVLDLSLMRKGAQVRFVGEFLDALYHSNREPLLVVIDEVARFCPQTSRGLMSPEIGKCIGAVDDIASLGRRRGLGVVLIGQRAARINKDVLTQCQTLIAMQTAGAPDRKALDEWINEQHGADESAREFKAQLTTLKVGEGFVWSPGFLGIFKRVRFRNRHTFDSSRTPKIGEKVISPKAFAQVDLEQLTSDLAAAKDRAKADDPKALRAEIAGLKSEVAKFRNSATAAPERIEVERIVEVPVPVLGDDDRRELHKTLSEVQTAARFLVDLGDCLSMTLEKLDAATAAAQTRNNIPEKSVRNIDREIREPSNRKVSGAKPSGSRAPEGSPSLGKAHRALLTALAQNPSGVDRDRLGILAGYSSSSGHFDNTLGSLRASGYVERGTPIRITQEGLDVLGDFDPLPQGEDLRAYWLGRLGKAERAILAALMEAYPRALTRDELGDASGYSPSSGHFDNTLGRLRTLTLVSRGTPIRASEALFA